MRIGLDFDNTIVCYDQAITLLAEELFELPKDLPRTKLALRDFLRASGREQAWTSFQGELYGPGMRYAQPYDGAIDKIRQLESEGHELMIISHRSRSPYAGRPYNLHASARDWVSERLQSAGILGSAGDHRCVHLMESFNKKIEMINTQKCNLFLDDLPEVLVDSGLPRDIRRILFDPSDTYDACQLGRIARISKWRELSPMLTV